MLYSKSKNNYPNNNNEIYVSLSLFINIADYFVHSGPPLAPSVSLDKELMENESCLFTLSWTTPFSWSEFPITGYTIILSNYSNGEPFNTSFMENNITDSYLIQFNSTGNECYRLEFLVSANNSLGEGQPTIIHSGHPIIGNYNTDPVIFHVCYNII